MNENKALYMLEGIACILVVFIHCGFPGIFGSLIETISRIAVPIFFMVSGYFNYKSDNEKIKNKIKKQTKIFLIVYLIYLVYCNIENIILNGKDTLINYNKEIFSLDYIIQFFTLNRVHVIATHLWFIPALIYCYITKIIFNKFPKLKKYNLLIIVIPIVKYILELFFIFNNNYEGYFFRNWIFVGLPFFYLGEFIKNNEISFTTLSNKKNIFLCIISFICLIIERIGYKVIFNENLQVFASTYFLCITLFLLCINNKEKHIQFLYVLGKKHSLTIYLFHNLFNYFINNIIIIKLQIEINEYIIPIYVIASTIIFSWIIDKIKTMKNREIKLITSK